MPTEAEIQKRIAEEQAKIDVPSYQDVAFDGAWKRRSAMIWGLAIVGAISGAGIGALALLAPAIFTSTIGFSLTAPLVAKSIAAFSAFGLSAGWVAGALAGFPSGAAAATIKEFERRTLARDIEQKIRDNPEATVTITEHAVEPKKEDTGISGYFNWKSALVLAGIGAIGGAIFAAALVMGGPAAHFAMPAMEFLLGSTAATTAPGVVAAYTIGLGAISGAFFGTNIPRIGRNAGNFMAGILGGQSIGAPWPKSANLPEQKPILTPVVTVPEQEQVVESKFADKIQRAQSYEALLTQSAKEAECGCNSRA